ncbi:unnamed protein product [Cylicostephanus goldi]|uniref:SCP domain-containing protein n=1 Tax=Cylicostephanus goldi TaxID=71465 RepID=A0A3P6R1X3_CYLGO|nr:unnamed protein product [Cylicostephanus goldi]
MMVICEVIGCIMFRAKLALGEILSYDGRRLPPAKNMLKLSYACELEASATHYAAHCPSMRSRASSRPNQGENFLRLTKVGFPSFAGAVNMTVYDWWSVVGDTRGINNTAELKAHHLRSPIASFTQVIINHSQNKASLIMTMTDGMGND